MLQVKQANDILAKYAPKTQPGYYPYLGMAGAIAFHKAAEAAGKELTRAKLIAALEGFASILKIDLADFCEESKRAVKTLADAHRH